MRQIDLLCTVEIFKQVSGRDKNFFVQRGTLAGEVLCRKIPKAETQADLKVIDRVAVFTPKFLRDVRIYYSRSGGHRIPGLRQSCEQQIPSCQLY